MTRLLLSIALVLSISPAWSQQSVISQRPRVLLNATIKNQLIARKDANDPTWLALKAEADSYATWPVVAPYSNPANQNYRDGEINYYYQGGRWAEVTLPLALAYQITGDAKYADKLKQLADVIIAAGDAPIRVGAGYPARNIGRVVGIIYDWCYEVLSAQQRAGLVSIMKEYYKFLRFDDPNGGAYQNYENATGNYYWGNPDAAAFMGYAMAGDDALGGDANISSAEMIAWARYRFDGLVVNDLPAQYRSFDYVKQTFDGGYPTLAGRSTNLAVDKGNPHKGGIHAQGWSYGSDVFSQYIDYVQTVKTATGEDLITPNQQWWMDMLKAQKHSLLPNGYHADEAGDNGTNYGIRIRKSLPLRLAYVLQGSVQGQQAQSFLKTELISAQGWEDKPVEPEPWEAFYYSVNQAQAPLMLPLYFSGIANGYNLGAGNGALPYFLMRSQWGTSGSWLSYQAGSATIDDHDHFNAGNIDINYRGAYILSSPSESNYAEHSGASSTLFIDDRGTFQAIGPRTVGGQFIAGRTQLSAVSQTDSITYVRSILTTAYNRNAQNLTAAPANRKLNYFLRTFLYIRASNIVVVYDQVSVKNPDTGAPFNRHIRWHFANNAPKPVITANKIKAITGQSSLHIHTVLPQNPSIALVDQRNNPDAGNFGANYYFNTNTWRAEVAGDLTQSETTFLSVLQPGASNQTEMATTSMLSLDGKMDGVAIKTGSRYDVVFFSKQSADSPAPIETVHVPISGDGFIVFTISGMEPASTYKMTLATDGKSLTLSKQTDGNIPTDAAGVARFSLVGNNPLPDPVTSVEGDWDEVVTVYPNPSNGLLTIQSGRPLQKVTVLNQQGQVVTTGSNTNQIDLRGYPSGIYFLRLQLPEGTITRKISISAAEPRK